MSNWVDDFVRVAEKEMARDLENLVDEKGIKDKVLASAQGLAKIVASRAIDDSRPGLPPFPSVSLDTVDQELQYLLVLEFLESTGFKFASNALRFESQHPEVRLNRRELGRRLHLCTYDRTPFLVQLIEEQAKVPEG
jgi:hypothetical protein